MLTNIGRSDDDPSYRYKMPKIQTKIESGGNGIKTVIVNMIAVSRALGRPPTYITKFFGCELGTIAKMDEKSRRFIVNGKHDPETLQKLINRFIDRFVLCPKCRYPETSLEIDAKKKTIKRNCVCCGHVSDVDTTHKLCTFIFNNPMAERIVKGTAAAGAADDSDGDLDIDAPPPGGDFPDDDDVEWHTDVSAEAVAKRQAEAARAAAVVEGPDEGAIGA